MISVKRLPENPLITPTKDSEWETKAVFNGSVAKFGTIYQMVYRAMSVSRLHFGKELSLSTIGTAESADGIHFHHRRPLITPFEEWERYGCEDPRVTFFEGKYYIFYTALSHYPPAPNDIRIALVATTDFSAVETRKLITPFNAKAGTLFPERINGKVAMLLTVNTDNPPSCIACITADSIEQLYSHEYWNEWYKEHRRYALPLVRSEHDHVEIGAPPIKTDHGWLLLYSYIVNYFKKPMVFTVEAVLLDIHNPAKIIGRTKHSLLEPHEYYELYGDVPNIVFPSGAVVKDDELLIYYGAADTSICAATLNFPELIEEMTTVPVNREPVKLVRYEGNPIISPIHSHQWENRATFNPAAVYLGGKVHILYRSWNTKDVSMVGYASSPDGFHIDERLPEPIYVPKASFETSENSDSGFGCEDARIIQIDDRLYMTYTAYSGGSNASVAITSISVEDFLRKKWNWKEPKRISPPGIFDKNSALLPEKVNGKYAIFHRIDHYIWVDYVDDLEFTGTKWIEGQIVLRPRPDSWDSLKIGICSSPIKSDEGWIMLYHGLSSNDGKYRVGAALLDLTDLDDVRSRLKEPLLEPVEPYELKGERPGTVFPCGVIRIDNTIYVYYGAADQYTAVATIDFRKLVKSLT